MGINNFFAIGIDHKKFNIEEREEFLSKKPEFILEKLHFEDKISGYVVLSTCLRVEYYIYTSLSKEKLLEYFKDFNGLFCHESEKALNYLFSVVCGFESVIKGEDQILAQIKKAHKKYLLKETTCSELNTIFNKSIELGKKFRHLSKINHNALSLEAISLKFIKGHIEDINSKNILLLGTGDLSLDILHLLKVEGAQNITITNRSIHKAMEVKNLFDVNLIDFSKKNKSVLDSDVIVSATSAPHHILHFDELKDILIDGRSRIFLDLAVPRDIDSKLSSLEGVTIYNLDDIWNTYYKNVENRSNLLDKYRYLLEEQLEVVLKWFYFKNKNSM